MIGLENEAGRKTRPRKPALHSPRRRRCDGARDSFPVSWPWTVNVHEAQRLAASCLGSSIDSSRLRAEKNRSLPVEHAACTAVFEMLSFFASIPDDKRTLDWVLPEGDWNSSTVIADDRNLGEFWSGWDWRWNVKREDVRESKLLA